MRKACLSCVLKHLASAAVAETEVRMGYPNFRIYVVGNLDHASQECQQAYHELAMVIREHRIKYMEKRFHIVPYESLYAFVETCIQLENTAATSYPTIPENCTQGLDLDDSGCPKLSGDTRP